jgi:hypothetical protein
MPTTNVTPIDADSGNALTRDARPKAPAYDPNKDYISTLLLELCQATAIVDLLYMVSSGGVADEMFADTLGNSLHTVLERLHAVKAAADAILDETSPPVLGQVAA